MSNSSGLITKPINLQTDIYAVLGVGKSGSYYDVGYICSNAHGKINKFARYKPVRIGSFSGVTDTQRAAVNHGLELTGTPVSVSSIGTDTATLTAIQDAINNCAWDYLAPEPGTNWCRMTDFENYYHYAVPPIQCVYPDEGWEVNGTTGKTLDVYCDLDPGDSQYNLQSYDLKMGSILQLQYTYLVVALCRYDDTPLQIARSVDTLLDANGNTQSPYVSLSISGLSQMQQAYRYRVYACLCYHPTVNSSFVLYPLPSGSGYNPKVMYLNVINDASEGGGGVEDENNDISFCPGFNEKEYKAAKDCAYTGTYDGKYVLRNNTGDLLVKCTLTNSTTTAATFERKHFSIKENYTSDQTLQYATNLYTSQPTGVDGDVSSITVPAEGTVVIYIYFQAFLSFFTDTAINSTIEIEFKRSGFTIWSGELNYCYGSLAWVEKS